MMLLVGAIVAIPVEIAFQMFSTVYCARGGSGVMIFCVMFSFTVAGCVPALGE